MKKRAILARFFIKSSSTCLPFGFSRKLPFELGTFKGLNEIEQTLELFNPPFSHTSLLYLCLPHRCADRIFTTIPLFYLSQNKLPVFRVTPSHWDGESAHYGGIGIRALIIFSKLKKSLVVSGFKPQTPV